MTKSQNTCIRNTHVVKTPWAIHVLQFVLSNLHANIPSSKSRNMSRKRNAPLEENVRAFGYSTPRVSSCSKSHNVMSSSHISPHTSTSSHKGFLGAKKCIHVHSGHLIEAKFTHAPQYLHTHTHTQSSLTYWVFRPLFHGFGIRVWKLQYILCQQQDCVAQRLPSNKQNPFQCGHYVQENIPARAQIVLLSPSHISTP